MKTYNEGAQDTISMWGRVCGSVGSCDECPIGALRGDEITCQEFAAKFPQKMLSILKELDRNDVTYYQEFCMRFPHQSLPLAVVASCVCRKLVFEGYLQCEDAEVDGACEECWKETYTGDSTMDVEPEYESFEADGMFSEVVEKDESEGSSSSIDDDLDSNMFSHLLDE